MSLGLNLRINKRQKIIAKVLTKIMMATSGSKNISIT